MSSTTPSKSKNDKSAEPKKQEIKSKIAKGISEEEAIKQRNDLFQNLQPKDKKRLDQYLPPTQPPTEEEPTFRKKLTTKQKLALKRRRGDKRVKHKLAVLETKRVQNAVRAADAELILQTEAPGYLEPEHELEKTYKVTQKDLRQNHLEENVSNQIYDLRLEEYGPYGFKYTKSGRFGLLYGSRGHIAVMDCHERNLVTEFHAGETVRDGTFLHNETLYGVAQKQHVFVYDTKGTEIHRLNGHTDPFALDYLPYHWLLVSIGRTGYLKYHDTSTGQLVSQHNTKSGCCSVLRQNPGNAVMHCGHSNGTVTLWSPASSQYLVKMLAHKSAPIHDVAISGDGVTMVTTASDSKLKVWDLRTFKVRHEYYVKHRPAQSLDISATGVLGVGHGPHVTYWPKSALVSKVASPYMYHSFLPNRTSVQTLRFRPFEDVCAVAHDTGLSSLVIPGAGEPNLDSVEYHLDPYRDTKRRREAEVRSLLDKLSPDMIALEDGVIGSIEKGDDQRQLEKQELMKQANPAKPKKEKKRMRGRGSIGKKLARKQKNVVDANMVKLKEMREKEEFEKKGEGGGVKVDAGPGADAPIALRRFFK